MMRKAGVQVSSIPNFQVDDPSLDDHSIYFKETQLQIPLSLDGAFSYFPTNKSTEATLANSETIYILTPEYWNPHSTAYAANEESMLDWEGSLVKTKFRRSEIPLINIHDDATISALLISLTEQAGVDKTMELQDLDAQYPNDPLQFEQPPVLIDQVSSVLRGISTTLDDPTMYELLEQRAATSRFKMAIGATTIIENMEDLDSDDDEIPTLWEETRYPLTPHHHLVLHRHEAHQVHPPVMMKLKTS
mmetsp:Transcript_37468/g.52825  ORF Transcript_37468/g.52825 Transcript_37468/m.52825 type:complete len:247 (+) Transcript_37468:50-790(+)